MEEKKTFLSRFKRAGPRKALLLVIIGLLVNLLGARVAGALHLPLYLDVIGTILTASLGGFIPGLAVGFFSNLINAIFDSSAPYYGVINVLIAVMAAFFAQKGFMRRFPHVLIPLFSFTAVAGTLSCLLTYGLFGFEFGTGISADLAKSIHETGVGVFASQFAADMIYDLADKAISTILVFLILLILPKQPDPTTRFQRWEKEALNDPQHPMNRKGFSRTFSLRTKFIAAIAAATMIIAVVVTYISYLQFHQYTISAQLKQAEGVVNVVRDSVDPKKVDEYLIKGENAEGYWETELRLSSLMRSSDDIEYVYVYRILKDGCHVVFDPDTPTEKGAAPGTLIPFDDAFKEYVPSLLNGEEIPPIISNETYGWLLTLYKPLTDKDGRVQAYIGVDISMSLLSRIEIMFVTHIIALFAGFFILILAAGIYLANYGVILPLNSIAISAGNFTYDSEHRRKSLENLKSLNIHTGDEIENLYTAFVRTSEATIHYIEDAEEKTEQISRLQNGLILVLADLVESRDKCTGNHVRNTASYVRIIMDQMKEEHLYPDQLTEDFMFDVISTAPLHDVGKIQVPDAILNKPGKLTDEEFRKMKDHASAGGEIITRAIGNMLDEDTYASYLREAINLATYHHERWDGRGYPKGLAGQRIPLSARIMAVADVFDALVARRSYKAGFPVEKALAIIEEGVGTQFDPYVATAFLHAEDRIREVVRKNQAADAAEAAAAAASAARAADEAARAAADANDAARAAEAAREAREAAADAAEAAKIHLEHQLELKRAKDAKAAEENAAQEKADAKDAEQTET